MYEIVILCNVKLDFLLYHFPPNLCLKNIIGFDIKATGHSLQGDIKAKLTFHLNMPFEIITPTIFCAYHLPNNHTPKAILILYMYMNAIFYVLASNICIVFDTYNNVIS